MGTNRRLSSPGHYYFSLQYNGLKEDPASALIHSIS